MSNFTIYTDQYNRFIGMTNDGESAPGLSNAARRFASDIPVEPGQVMSSSSVILSDSAYPALCNGLTIAAAEAKLTLSLGTPEATQTVEGILKAAEIQATSNG